MLNSPFPFMLLKCASKTPCYQTPPFSHAVWVFFSHLPTEWLSSSHDRKEIKWAWERHKAWFHVWSYWAPPLGLMAEEACGRAWSSHHPKSSHQAVHHITRTVYSGVCLRRCADSSLWYSLAAAVAQCLNNHQSDRHFTTVYNGDILASDKINFCQTWQIQNLMGVNWAVRS